MAVRLKKPEDAEEIWLMATLCGDTLGDLPGDDLESRSKWAHENIWWYNSFKDGEPSGYVGLGWSDFDEETLPVIHFGLVEHGDVRTVLCGWSQVKRLVPRGTPILAYIKHSNVTIARLATILQFEKYNSNYYIYRRK